MTSVLVVEDDAFWPILGRHLRDAGYRVIGPASNLAGPSACSPTTDRRCLPGRPAGETETSVPLAQ